MTTRSRSRMILFSRGRWRVKMDPLYGCRTSDAWHDLQPKIRWPQQLMTSSSGMKRTCPAHHEAPALTGRFHPRARSKTACICSMCTVGPLIFSHVACHLLYRRNCHEVYRGTTPRQRISCYRVSLGGRSAIRGLRQPQNHCSVASGLTFSVRQTIYPYPRGRTRSC